jgi:predicted nucleic acid-binding protein
MPKKLLVFLDANVIFSALYSSKGAPNAILEAYVEGKIEVVISHQVIEETILNIQRKKPDLLPNLYFFLQQAPFEIQPDPSVEDIARWAKVINPPDAPILAAAIAAGPGFLVTGNTQHFTLEVAKKAKLRILTPAQFIQTFAEAIKRYMSQYKQRIALEKGFGAWSSENHPELKTPEDTVIYVSRLRESYRERLTDQ